MKKNGGYVIRPHILSQVRLEARQKIADRLGMTMNAFSLQLQQNNPDGVLTRAAFLLAFKEIVGGVGSETMEDMVEYQEAPVEA